MAGYPVPIAFSLTLAIAATGIAAAWAPVEWLAPTDGATLEVVESERTEQRYKTVYPGARRDCGELDAPDYGLVLSTTAPQPRRLHRLGNYLARSISGEPGLLAAAVTFRRAPSEAEEAAGPSCLDTLRLCTPATATAICR